MTRQVKNKKLYHVTAPAPYKKLLVANQAIKTTKAHNPFFGFYENPITFPVTDHRTGAIIQVKAIDWLKRVRTGNISPHSVQVFANNAADVAVHYVMFCRELIMEEMRVKAFKTRPSRQTCIYAADTLAEAQIWNATLGGAGTICELTCTGTIFRADSSLLLGDSEPLSITRDRARQYWRGVVTATPKMETLFVGKAKVTAFGL